jgi:hypothetical protein
MLFINFNNQFIYLLLINLLFIKSTLAHSWVSCTDYQLSNEYPKDITTNSSYMPISNSINYEIDKCLGFSRNYQLQHSSDINRGFGYDTGYNFRSSECKYSYESNYYSSDIPMAKYNPGSSICLTYPSKTHVAATCTSKHILDNGMKIYRSIKKSTDDFSKEYNHLNGKHQIDTIDYQGFHNCPGFCNNMDKTVCYMCFNLESDIESGIYSFKWVWEFNPGEQYSTCWDAEITNSNKSEKTPDNKPKKTPDNKSEKTPDNKSEKTPDNKSEKTPDNNQEPCSQESRRLNGISYKYQKNLLCSNSKSNQEPSNTPSFAPNNEILSKKKCVPKENNPSPSNNPSQSNNQQQSNNPSSSNNPPTSNNQQQSNNPSSSNNPPTSNNQQQSNNPSSSNNPSQSNNQQQSNIVDVWGQCGGNNIDNKECNNSVCIKYSIYYSQCLPYELEKNTLCGQDDGKEIKWFYNKCKNSLKCLKMPSSMDYRCI